MKIGKNIVTWIVLALTLIPLAALAGCGNSPPQIMDISAASDTVRVAETVELYCEAADPDSDSLEYRWSVTSGSIISQSPEAEWTAPDEPGRYTVTVIVRDPEGNENIGTLDMYVAANLPPSIDSLLMDPPAVGEGQECYLKCGAHDPEGRPLTYSWEVQYGTITGSGPEVLWQLPYDEKDAVVKVTVTDVQGQSSSLTTNVSIVPNHDPEIESFNAVPRNMAPGAVSSITCLAVDPDGDELSYAWEATGGAIEGEGSEITWTAPSDCSSYLITVTVTDGRDGIVVKDQALRVAKPGG